MLIRSITSTGGGNNNNGGGGMQSIIRQANSNMSTIAHQPNSKQSHVDKLFIVNSVQNQYLQALQDSRPLSLQRVFAS